MKVPEVASCLEMDVKEVRKVMRRWSIKAKNSVNVSDEELLFITANIKERLPRIGNYFSVFL